MFDRFSNSLNALGVAPDALIGIAVSGGPDSLALLVLAAKVRPDRVFAATVDHGLRPAAHDEAAAVAAMCAGLGVPHETLSVDVTGSIQAAARDARYAALIDWCRRHALGWLATAHHADDQAETLLMRLNRGSGLAGLAGVRRSRPIGQGVRLIRPLLDWRKSDLEALVSDAGWVAAVDPSNTDPAYDRTAMRALLTGLDPTRLANSAAHLAEAEDALAWATDRAAAERIKGSSLDPSGLPAEIIRRLMLRMFAAYGETPRGPELSRLIDGLRSGRAATLAGLKASPGARWTLTPAPPHA